MLVRSRLASLAMLFALCLLLMLGGCGNDVTGTYTWTSPEKQTTLVLKPGGKAVCIGGGETLDGTYTLQGDLITVTIQHDTVTFTRQKDGSLTTKDGSDTISLKKM